MAELIVARLTGKSVETYQSAEMRYGIEEEPNAVAAYEFMYDVEAQKCSFIKHPTIEFSGASPDRLIGTSGLLEIKCPNTATHIDTLLNGTVDRAYILQMQWQLAVTQRDWCDFASYDGRLPPAMHLYVKRFYRDERLISELTVSVKEFIEELNEKTLALQAKYNLIREAA